MFLPFAADVETTAGFDWTTLFPLIGTVLGILGTIAGISVKAVFDGKIDRARVVREIAASKKLEKEQAQVKVEELAREVAGLFLDELQVVRQFKEEHHSVGFPIWYEERWRTEGDIPFRRVIATVRDADQRAQLIEIIDSIDDFQSLAQWKNYWSRDQRWVEDSLTLGFDLASTMARGQEIDPALLKRYIDFRIIVNGWQDHQEEQRRIQAETREDLMDKKAAKAETAGSKPRRTSKPGPS